MPSLQQVCFCGGDPISPFAFAGEPFHSPLFAGGGIFLEQSSSDSTAIRFCTFSGLSRGKVRDSCGGIGGGNGWFLSVSLSAKGSEGFVRDSVGFLGNEEERRLEETALEGVEERVVVEEETKKEKKSKSRGRVHGARGTGAMNTTKHLWAGAVAAMVSKKQLLRLSGNEETTNFERFLAGAAAGITASTLCLPLDTIRTKMMAPGGEALGGVIGVCWHMIHTEGFFSLYKGLVPSLVSMAPSGAVFYGVYDILKSAYLHSPKGKKRLLLMKQQKEEVNALDQLELGPVRTLLYGAIAGCAAEAATFPFEVVRRQLQLQVQANKMSSIATLAKVVEQGGIPALYAGLIPSLLQVLPSASISYFVYEFMKIVLKVE